MTKGVSRILSASESPVRKKTIFRTDATWKKGVRDPYPFYLFSVGRWGSVPTSRSAFRTCSPNASSLALANPHAAALRKLRRTVKNGGPDTANHPDPLLGIPVESRHKKSPSGDFFMPTPRGTDRCRAKGNPSNGACGRGTGTFRRARADGASRSSVRR